MASDKRPFRPPVRLVSVTLLHSRAPKSKTVSGTHHSTVYYHRPADRQTSRPHGVQKSLQPDSRRAATVERVARRTLSAVPGYRHSNRCRSTVRAQMPRIALREPESAKG